VRRHRRALLLAGLLIATLFMGVMTTLWQERLALRNARRDLMLPQLALYTYAILAAAGLAVYFSRATSRRLAGALVGASAFVLTGVVAVRATFLLGWWRLAASDLSLAMPVGLVVIDAAGYAAILALLSWRVGRRFGWRGQPAFTLVASVWGAARDYAGAAANGLVTIAPGIAPFLGWSTAWCCGIVVMEAAMRLVAGPPQGDQLRNRDGQSLFGHL
jgi:hypothetical protein